jgi:uncharacterized cupin superfamily protein
VDEFVIVLEGKLTLVTTSVEKKLGRRECAAFKAGGADGKSRTRKGLGFACQTVD